MTAIGRRSSPPTDLAIILGLIAFAAVARWPNLWLIPQFTDETLEARLAIQILRSGATPLTNVDPYIGALWNYLLAGGFAALGVNPWLPRLFAFLAGVATVAAAWWLGREVAGRVGGSVTALFMASSSTHVLVNSHVGWSHSITPLFTTLAFACLVRGLGTPPSGPLLVVAAFILGVGVQTHLTAALLIPGAALAVLIRWPGIVRTRWSLLAPVALLIAISNLLVFNLETGGQSFAGGREVIADYTREDGGFDPDSYVENLGRLTLAASWILSGAIEKRRFVGESLADPLPLLYLLVGLGSMIWAARRGYILPLLVAIPYALTLPLVNPKYEPLLNGRYLVPLLPLVYSSIGLVAAETLPLLWRRSRVISLGLSTAIVMIAIYPLAPMLRYQSSTERTNHNVLSAYGTVAANRAPDDVVLLDYGLDGVFFMAAGSAFKSMELLFSSHDVPYVAIDARPNSLSDAIAERSPRLAVLHTDKVAPLGRSFNLTPLGQQIRGVGFGVYRVAPR